MVYTRIFKHCNNVKLKGNYIAMSTDKTFVFKTF